MILLKCSPVGRATLTMRATTLEEALKDLPLFMQPFPDEAAEYQLIENDERANLTILANILVSYEIARFVMLGAIAKGTG
jgi:hypothetical protein